jgi:nucleotide-binding universal stress UspA family protein
MERLRFVAPFNESHKVPVEHIVASGSAGKVIAEYAEKFGADLVVLGSLENELAEEDFAVLQVISKVKCPVLCLPLVTNARPAELTYEVATFAGVAK